MKTTQRVLAFSLLACVCFAHAADTLYDQRFTKWQHEAEKGDAEAQYKLGNTYMRGTEVTVNLQKAIQWFRKAADQGNAKAQYKLGYLYYTGNGLQQDYHHAFQLLRKAAEQDYSPAQYYLGKMYADGDGVQRDYDKALYWLTQAAADNFGPAKGQIAKVKEAIAAEADAQRAVAAKEPDKQPVRTAVAVKPKIATPASKPVDYRHRLLAGHWLTPGGVPAKHMPSAISVCDQQNGTIICTTKPLKRSNLFAQITYVVEAKFGRFSSDGKFFGSYRSNNLVVKPEDPEDKDLSEEDLPRQGWQAPVALRCQFTNPKLIDCINDNFDREQFSLQ